MAQADARRNPTFPKIGRKVIKKADSNLFNKVRICIFLFFIGFTRKADEDFDTVQTPVRDMRTVQEFVSL